MNKSVVIFLLSFCAFLNGHAQIDSVVSFSNIHTNLYLDTAKLELFFMIDGVHAKEVGYESYYTLDKALGTIIGTSTGLFFDFGDTEFSGTLIYGLIPYGDSKHPHPVYFRSSAEIVEGKATIHISRFLSGRYDMVGWQEKGYGTLGYRLIDDEGRMIYDGKISFLGTGPFKIAPTIIEGPFINLIQPTGTTISFNTNKEITSEIIVDGKSFKNKIPATHHEIEIKGLSANTDYAYIVKYGTLTQEYSFHTSPQPGARTEFTFAYASDSRSGNGGGERDIYGANSYVMKKIMALAQFKGIRFAQFSGDLINGYLTEQGDMDLQYSNWKRAVEPFGHYFPIYTSMGNHESFMRVFQGGSKTYRIDRLPYAIESSEVIFANHFVNPTNGPASEDGAKYDPDFTQIDFPPYEENVFYYTYDNVGVIVLNSNYWYSPSTAEIPKTGGGLHGYIMDNQLNWLKKTLKSLEKEKNIDHVFVTQHTPIFPNGGHVGDDMWYRGDNTFRPYVAGKPLKNGIIERRDQILDLIVNQSTKVIAVLTGDEHNYCRTEIGPETQIYDEKWEGKKLELSRTIYQINNGAAGAPYYAQEQTPWTPFTSSFTTQNALVFFHIDGDSVRMEVLNPDTLETVDEFDLR